MKFWLCSVIVIVTSQGIWLTGDLTNHNVEPAIFVWQESRLTSVDLSLKNGVFTSFCSWNKIPSDVHSCLFHAITSNIKRWSVHVTLELRRYSDLSQHIKEPHNGIYCLNFFFFLKTNLKACFIAEVTRSVLSVGALSVFCLLPNVFFTVWEHGVWSERGTACRTFPPKLPGAICPRNFFSPRPVAVCVSIAV